MTSEIRSIRFWGHNSAPWRSTGTRIGGNFSYRSPGAFPTLQDLEIPSNTTVLNIIKRYFGPDTFLADIYFSIFFSQYIFLDLVSCSQFLSRVSYERSLTKLSLLVDIWAQPHLKGKKGCQYVVTLRKIQKLTKLNFSNIFWTFGKSPLLGLSENIANPQIRISCKKNPDRVTVQDLSVSSGLSLVYTRRQNKSPQ